MPAAAVGPGLAAGEAPSTFEQWISLQSPVDVKVGGIHFGEHFSFNARSLHGLRDLRGWSACQPSAPQGMELSQVSAAGYRYDNIVAACPACMTSAPRLPTTMAAPGATAHLSGGQAISGTRRWASANSNSHSSSTSAPTSWVPAPLILPAWSRFRSIASTLS